MKIFVGKNFHKEVIETDKDVIVNGYVQWSGACKRLDPIWEQLAIDLKDVPNLVIAKIDLTANEVPELEVKGYPSVNFFGKG